jgi:hypothetical protein
MGDTIMPASNTASFSRIALNFILAVFGALVIFTALNRAFGGIATLGWQGPVDFFTVANPAAFAVQDNHTRFLGGVWLAVGLAFLAALLNLRAMRPVLLFCCAAVFLGGLARFTSLDFAVTLGPDIIVSLILELALMPIVFFWLSRTRLD